MEGDVGCGFIMCTRINRARAQKVADFVAKKIRKNEMPPTVAIEDLNNMSVLKAK